MEYRIVHANGEIRWVFDKGRADNSGTERTPTLTGTIMDISERKQTELELDSSRRRLALALSAGRMTVWERDMVTGKTTIGALFQDLLGYAPGEIEDSFDAWLSVIHKDDLPVLKRAYYRYLRGKDVEFKLQYRASTRGGELRWFEAAGMITERDEHGRPVKMMGTQHDITAQKQAELLLREKLGELETFNKLAIGRELRMIELKKQVNELSRKLGQERLFPEFEE
jgi:PAS domain S-box-containing protein